MSVVDGSSWRTRIEEHKYTMLLVSLLVLVVAPLLAGNSPRRSIVFGVASLGVLLFGIVAVAVQRRTMVLAIALGLPVAAVQSTGFVYSSRTHTELGLVVFAAFLTFLAVMIVRDVLRNLAVTWDKISGTLCAYLLIGVAWGLLYAWIALLDPQAFSGSGLESAQGSGEPMIYYSFVTLTTLGYGDILPVSHAARTLAWLEAVFGQIYLVVLVARLVSLKAPRN